MCYYNGFTIFAPVINVITLLHLSINCVKLLKTADTAKPLKLKKEEEKMNVLGLEIKERKLKREEVLLLTADVLACEGVIKETRGDKNGKLILSRRELITALFASGIRMISLYGVLDKTVAEQVILT